MPAARSLFVASNALLAQPTIRPARISKKEQCRRLDKAPYVCNGRDKEFSHCTIAHKYNYNARSGIGITKHELHPKDMIVTSLIEQGPSPYQIAVNHPELDMSVRTIYTYIDKGLFSSRNIDLKRKPKFKPRKCHKTQIKDRSVFISRTYLDFQALELNSFTEMDTVHSSRECRKTLLTFYFTKEKLFLAFVMNQGTKGSVRLVFDHLEKHLGTFGFLSLFEYGLTDRGFEFGVPEGLETGINEVQRSNLYYCNPMRSGQKGGVENVHTMLRMVLPRGISFEFLTKWDVNLIVNHINSTPRESLGGKTPYVLALKSFGEDTLKALQLKRIAPNEVNLTSKLIRFNR